jgi:hypothetical protein
MRDERNKEIFTAVEQSKHILQQQQQQMMMMMNSCNSNGNNNNENEHIIDIELPFIERQQQHMLHQQAIAQSSSSPSLFKVSAIKSEEEPLIEKQQIQQQQQQQQKFQMQKELSTISERTEISNNSLNGIGIMGTTVTTAASPLNTNTNNLYTCIIKNLLYF